MKKTAAKKRLNGVPPPVRRVVAKESYCLRQACFLRHWRYLKGRRPQAGREAHEQRELHSAFKKLNHELVINARKADQKLNIANGLCLTGGDVSNEFKTLLKEN